MQYLHRPFEFRQRFSERRRHVIPMLFKLVTDVDKNGQAATGQAVAIFPLCLDVL